MGLNLQPLGLIRTPHKELDQTPIQPCFAEGIRGEIHLDPAFAEGLEGLDGTPLLDIKPYYPKADRPDAAWGGWTEHLDPEEARRIGSRKASD